MNEVNIELWKQANDIYAKLMELTVTDALSSLSQMENLDDELKALVLTLISSGNQSSQYFKQNISANFQVHNIAGGHQIGDVIDGYQLLEEIGDGGMAKVYKAKRVDVDAQKPVAVKLFKRSDVSPVLLSRFSIEQEILSELSHPNIVNMHHGGTDDQGSPYIVMELIEDATDIDQYVKGQSLSLKQKVKLIVTAARAIAYAHNNLIVHRDIKPSNLLISDSGELKVVDFGIAKLMTKEDAPQKTTIMALTPSFAAPEQINSGKISVTTDIFSLAAVCLALIIEDLPLPGDRLLKSCAEDEVHIWHLLKNHVKDRDLRNVLNRALQQDPLNRYKNMDLFAVDLSAWLVDKPVKATPDSWFYRISKFAIRRRALFATMSTLMITLGLGFVVLTWQYNKTKQEAQKALEVKKFMLNVFSVTHPDVNQGEAVSALDLLRKARVDIDQNTQFNPQLKSELLLAIGTAMYQVGDWETAKQTLSEAMALVNNNPEIILSYAEVLVALKEANEVSNLMQKFDQSAGGNLGQFDQARLFRLLAAIKSFNNDFSGSNQLLYQALESDKLNNNYSSLIEDVIAIVSLSYRRSKYDEGIELAEQTLKQYASLFPATNTQILKLKNELSVLYTKNGLFQKSQKLLEEMIAIEQEYLGADHPDLIQSMISLSESYYSQGEVSKAYQYSEQAHELTLKKFGLNHPKTIESITGLASVAFVMGDYEGSLSMMEQAIEMTQLQFGPSHADTLKLKRNYATALGALRRHKEGLEVLNEVLEIQTKTLGENHSDTLFTQISMVRSLGALGQQEEAIKLAEQVTQIINEDSSFKGPIVSNAQFALGFAYFEAEQYEDAITVFKAIETNELEEQDSPNSMVMSNTIARSYYALKDYSGAEIYANKSLELSNKLLGADNIRSWKLKLLLSEIYMASEQTDKALKLLVEIEPLITESAAKERDELLDKINKLKAELLHDKEN